MKIIRAGGLTTVQDLGRVGQRGAGVASGGAMDRPSLSVANLLVGNAENAAGLEMTLVGAEVEFDGEVWVAVMGADMGAVQRGRPLRVKAGERLKFGPARTGARTYLAIAGGIQIETVLGGRGTDLRAGLGIFRGRPLKAGDGLPLASPERKIGVGWWVRPTLFGEEVGSREVRILAGSECGEFARGMEDGEFRVSRRSDRMGIFLEGQKLVRTVNRELLSSAVAPGTVQVPPEGAPIVLMADAQTIGGYPRIAHVIAVDLPILAQMRSGEAVKFRMVDLAEAHQCARRRARDFGLLREGLWDKIR